VEYLFSDVEFSLSGQVTDGERLPLAVKELGSCDLYPQVCSFMGCFHSWYPFLFNLLFLLHLSWSNFGWHLANSKLDNIIPKTFSWTFWLVMVCL